MGALQAGHTYRLGAYLHTAIRADLASPGTYRLYLADTVAQATKVPIGSFCPIAAQAWEARSFDFVVPADAGALPILVFEPHAVASGGAYPGADDVELTDVTGCAR